MGAAPWREAHVGGREQRGAGPGTSSISALSRGAAASLRVSLSSRFCSRGRLASSSGPMFPADPGAAPPAPPLPPAPVCKTAAGSVTLGNVHSSHVSVRSPFFFLALESIFASKPYVALMTERQVRPGGSVVLSLPGPSPSVVLSAISWLHWALNPLLAVSITQGGRVR